MDSRTETLDKKIQALDAEIAKYTTQMKKMRDGPAKTAVKNKALRVLKQKKHYETQRERVAGQAFNAEQTSFAISSIQDTKATVAAMKVSAKTLSKEMKKIKIDDILDTQDDLADLMADSDDIQDAMASNFATPELDDGELEDELAALGSELDDSSYLDEAMNAPSVPSAVPADGGAPVSATESKSTIGGVQVDEFGLPIAE